MAPPTVLPWLLSATLMDSPLHLKFFQPPAAYGILFKLISQIIDAALRSSVMKRVALALAPRYSSAGSKE